MNPHCKIELTDTPLSAIVKMSEGNIGATTVLVNLFKEAGAIDPDSALGGFGAIMMLDSLGVYGSHIWILYKDICGEDLRVLCAMIRAWQMGHTSDNKIRTAITTMEHGRRDQHSLDVPALVAKVEADLPNFRKATVLA